jgi:uncharacterized protein YaaQ
MKLILAVIRDIDETQVIHMLAGKGIRTTRMSSTGGFLRRGNVTLMIGVEEDQIEVVIDAVKDACSAPEECQNQVVFFVFNAAHFLKV